MRSVFMEEQGVVRVVGEAERGKSREGLKDR
jgi:hypothetical protein